MNPFEAKNLLDKAMKVEANEPFVLCGLGEYYLQQEDIEKAMDYYKKSLKIDSQFVLAFIGLGQCFEKQKDRELTSAEEWYKAAIAARPGFYTSYQSLIRLYGEPECFIAHEKDIAQLVKRAVMIEPEEIYDIYLEAGLAYQKNQQHKQAREWYDKSISLDKTRIWAYIYMGYSYIYDSQYEKSRYFFRKVIELAPDSIEGYWGMSLSFEDANDWNSALDWYHESLLQRPEWEEKIRLKVGEMKVKLRRYEEAEEEFLKVLHSDIDNTPALNSLYDLAQLHYSTLNNSDAAVRIYKGIFEIKGKQYQVEFHSNLFRMFLDLKDWKKSKEESEYIFELDKKSDEHRKRMAMILSRKGDESLKDENLSKTLRLYDKASKINPSDSAIWKSKADAFFNLGRYEDAIKCYDEASRTNPSDSAIWKGKADAFFSLGRYEEAIKCYDEVLKLVPTEYTVLTKKGISLRRLGKYEESLRHYDKALDIYPGDAYTWNCKAFLFATMNRNEEALALVEEALKISPNNPKALDTKGLIYYNLGKYEEAMKYFDKSLGIEQHPETIKNRRSALEKIMKTKSTLS